jgi:eukaryotic-like serine/threonine-protein kinase
MVPSQRSKDGGDDGGEESAIEIGAPNGTKATSGYSLRDPATVPDPDSGPSAVDPDLPAALARITAYEVLGRVGDGGMGVVYRAFDPERQREVALKTLTRMDEASFERLKREFRVVADIAHPNLVTLHELRMEGGVPYFTMELVEGTDLLTYIRGTPPSLAAAAALDAPDGVLLTRLRASLGQLASGVCALHDAGKLHRDIKPSNVMVTPAGRVVVLDFGLALDGTSHSPERVAGTPIYMAPEQASGLSLTSAADWYALGVILFRALTGELPPGRSLKDIARGVPQHAERPSRRAPMVPADLDDLCFDLLQTTPSARPTGPQILDRLGEGAITGPRKAEPSFESRLIGRRRELAELDAAWAEALAGTSVVALVSGPSGIGKSALLHRWLASVQPGGGEPPLVLRSRCRERETFAFKVFDGFVEGIVDQFGRLVGGPEQLTLADTEALGRLFPVLQELSPSVEPSSTSDARHLRRRGFLALKSLFSQLARDRPLLLFIDDLQWSDGDSAELLGELLAHPAPKPLLIVATSRAQAGRRAEDDAADLLRGVDDLRFVELHLDSLDDEQAVALARQRAAELAATRRQLDDEELAALARESLGNPFLIEQLVFYAASQREPGSAPQTATSLQAVVQRRVDLLPRDASRLLELVAVAAAPISQRTVVDAASPDDDPWAAIALLRAESLVRTDGARGSDVIETWHDRIREAIVARLARARIAQHHLELANALERAKADGLAVEAGQLATHYHGAGDRERAGPYALEAATQARAGLAFDRAAQLYDLALECNAGTRAILLRRRADALVDGGRCAEAAPIYRQAALEGDPAEAMTLRGLAAEQLMASGRVDEGVAELIPVLDDLGLRYPRSAAQAIASLLLQVAKLKLRGLRFEPRDASRIDPEMLRRIDVCWGAGKGLLSFDSIRAAHFLIDMLLSALRAGEPVRASRALAIYGMMTVFDGTARGQREGRRALALAEKAAPEGHRYLEGTITICRGTAEMSIGAFGRGLELMERGVRMLEDGCANVRWECSAGRSSIFNALLWLGDVTTIAERAPAWRREGQQVGDIFAVVTGELYDAVARLAAGDPERARRGALGAIDKWSQKGFHYQHWLAEKVQIWCDLYQGEVSSAERRLSALLPRVKRSGLLRVQLMELDALMLRGRVAIASASGRSTGRSLREAARVIKRLVRLERPAALAAAQLLRGQVATLRGKTDRARGHLDDAVRGFDRAQTSMHALCTRRLLAELGDGSVDDVDAKLRRAGVGEPAKWARLYV